MNNDPKDDNMVLEFSEDSNLVNLEKAITDAFGEPFDNPININTHFYTPNEDMSDALNDEQILIILKKIDSGFKFGKKRLSMLSKIRSIRWEGIDEVPKSISCLTQLRKIDLSGEFHNKASFSSLPYTIGDLEYLQYIDLSSSMIRVIPDTIINLPALKELDLSNTEISELPEGIGNVKSLERLNLSWSRIHRLPESIGNLTNLRILNLQYSKISVYRKILDV